MKDQRLIRLESGGEFRYFDAAEIAYVEFNAQTGKRKAAMLVLFRSGEYVDLKGVWAEIMQKELDKIAAL